MHSVTDNHNQPALLRDLLLSVSGAVCVSVCLFVCLSAETKKYCFLFFRPLIEFGDFWRYDTPLGVYQTLDFLI